MKKITIKLSMLLAVSIAVVSCSVERNSVTRGGESGYGIGSSVASGSKAKQAKSMSTQETLVVEESTAAVVDVPSVALAEEQAKPVSAPSVEKVKISARVLKAAKKNLNVLAPKAAQTSLVKAEKKSPAKTMGDGSGWGIASLVCGILGFIILPILFGPLAIIFGALGLNKPLKGLAIAGMVLGFICLVIIFLLIGILLAVA